MGPDLPTPTGQAYVGVLLLTRRGGFTGSHNDHGLEARATPHHGLEARATTHNAIGSP